MNRCGAGSEPEHRLIPFLNFRLVYVGDICHILWSRHHGLGPPAFIDKRELLQFHSEKRQSKGVLYLIDSHLQ